MRIRQRLSPSRHGLSHPDGMFVSNPFTLSTHPCEDSAACPSSLSPERKSAPVAVPNWRSRRTKTTSASWTQRPANVQNSSSKPSILRQKQTRSKSLTRFEDPKGFAFPSSVLRLPLLHRHRNGFLNTAGVAFSSFSGHSASQAESIFQANTPNIS